MINPNFIHTITLFHKSDSGWIRKVYQNCFWKSGQSVTQNGTEASRANVYTVRIPEDEAGQDFAASTGDIAVLGECVEHITGHSPDTATEVLHRCKPDAFMVTAVTNNTAHRMGRHYRLGG